MSKSNALGTCPGCQRHVFLHDDLCPFCGTPFKSASARSLFSAAAAGLLIASSPVIPADKPGDVQTTSVITTFQQQVPQEAQNFFLQLFKSREDVLTKEQFNKLSTEVEAHTKKLDKASIPAVLNSYLKGKMKLVLDEIKAKTEGKKPGKGESIKNFIEEIRLVKDLGDGLQKSGYYSLNIAIPAQAISETKRMFGMMREYSIEEKLKESGLTRKEYKALIINLMSALPLISNFSEEPRGMAVYGKVIHTPKLPKVTPSGLPITSVAGEISVKQINVQEEPLKKDALIYLTSVLDNSKDEGGKITFSNGMSVLVNKKEILTGMELVPEYPKMSDKLEGEIKGLLKELGNEDAEKREKATDRLKEIGPICKKHLEEEMKKTSDPEVKSRIESILSEFKKKEGVNPIADDLKRSLN